MFKKLVKYDKIMILLDNDCQSLCLIFGALQKTKSFWSEGLPDFLYLYHKIKYYN